jgi:hypothetical protein
VRPRQVRYQAALRPDSSVSLILNHFQEAAKTLPIARAFVLLRFGNELNPSLETLG